MTRWKHIIITATAVASLSANALAAPEGDCRTDVASGMDEHFSDNLKSTKEYYTSDIVGVRQLERSVGELSCLDRVFNLSFDPFSVPSIEDLRKLANDLICEQVDKIADVVDEKINELDDLGSFELGEGDFKVSSGGVDAGLGRGGNANVASASVKKASIERNKAGTIIDDMLKQGTGEVSDAVNDIKIITEGLLSE